MFCPNCGNDCKDHPFCSQCGTSMKAFTDTQIEEFPEPGTEAFEAKRAELTRRRIPHCPRCLSTHIGVLHTGTERSYRTRLVCMWCGIEWRPYTKKEFEPSY